MADDLSSYALNLAFQLQAAPAVASLGDILTSFTSIQEQIAKISTALSGTITTTLTTIQDQVAKVSVSSTDITNNATKLEGDMDKIQKHYEQIDKLSLKTSKTELKSFLNFDKIRKWMPQLLREQKQISAESKTQSGLGDEISEIWQNITSSGDQALKQGKGQIGIGTQVAAAWHNVRGAIGGANNQCREQITVGSMVAAAWTNVKNAVVDTVLKFGEMLIGITAIKGAFALFVEEQNKFNTANYRIYGSQKEIIGQVNTLSQRYNIYRKVAMEAMVNLGGAIRENDTELGRLIVTNTMYSTILGINGKDLGAWQMAMRGIGFTAREGDAILLKYAQSMRQLGVSAQQIQKLMSDQAASAISLNTMYGKEGVQAFGEYKAGLLGIGQAMGFSQQQTDALQGTITKFWANPELSARIQALGKLTREEMASMSPDQQAITKLQRGTDAWVQMFQGRLKGLNSYQRGMTIERMETQLGMERGGLKTMIDVYDRGIKDHHNYLASQGADTKAFLEKNKAAMRAAMLEGMTQEQQRAYLYKEATDTISGKFILMWKTIENAFSNLFIKLEPGISWFIDKVLTPLVNAIAWVINAISGFVPAEEKASGALKEVSKTAEPVVGWFERMYNVLGSLGTIALVAAGGILAIGAALIGIGIGIALWKAFMWATDANKLLAIAVAAVAVGAGFFLLSIAFEKMAALGWAIIGPLVAVVVVIGTLTVALVALGTLGWLGVAAALALSVAFVALGFSALEVSWAFMNVVKSLQQLAEIGAMNLVGLGIALFAFGVALTLAAISIGAGAALMALAVIPLAIGMAGLSVAMFLLSDSAVEKMVTLSDGTLHRFGEALRTLGPGVASFISAMGWGVMFSSGMKGLAAGVGRLDPAQILLAGSALLLLGKALEMVARFNVDNLAGVGTSVLAFANALSETFDALRLAAERAVGSIVLGMFSMMFVMWQLRDSITSAFMDLLTVIPTITDVTNRIADAIESGQDKIQSQMDALRASFVALELISARLGVPTNIEEENKKKVVAETISTVQVKTETTGNVSARWRQEELQQKQIELMNTIAASVDKITGSSMDDVGIIKTLLQTYLPKMGESPTKLSSRLNNWS